MKNRNRRKRFRGNYLYRPPYFPRFSARVANRFLRERHARASSLRWLFPFLAPTLFHAARCHLFHKRGPLKGRFSFPPRLCARCVTPLRHLTSRRRDVDVFLRACARDPSTPHRRFVLFQRNYVTAASSTPRATDTSHWKRLSLPWKFR